MKRILDQFARRDAHPIVQFVKYGIGGVAASAADVLIFYLAAVWVYPCLASNDPAARLFGAHLAPIAEGVRSTHYVVDKTISFMFANYVAYEINIRWVFTPGRYGKWMEFALFYLVSGISFVLGTGLGWFLIRWGAMPTTYAYIANAVAALAVNFACRKFLIFKN